MERDKLVVRKVDPSDRRNNKIYRTETAEDLWEKMMQCVSNIKEISLKDIPDENITIMKIVLEKIWQNLRLHFDVDSVSINDNQNVASPVTPVKKSLSKEMSNKNGKLQRKRY